MNKKIKINHQNDGTSRLVGQKRFEKLKSEGLIHWDSENSDSGAWFMFEDDWNKEFPDLPTAEEIKTQKNKKLIVNTIRSIK